MSEISDLFSTSVLVLAVKTYLPFKGVFLSVQYLFLQKGEICLPCP